MTYGLPAEAAPGAPTCYRHPDRETWIRCTRCERPICPECMTAAAVGYQCPECVRAGAAQTRSARTVFGGSFSRDGAVSYTIIGLCVGLYVLVGWLGALGGLSRWGMQPVLIAVQGEWFRLVSSMFLHVGLLHLAFNMYVLYLLGPPLERVLGHGRFLTLFLLSGLGGSVASYAFSPLTTLSVGASGAIFGLMAAWIVVARRLNRDAGQVIVLLAINVALAALRFPAPVLVAGGIRPENVAAALVASGAEGVDVASGVESAPGIKDPEKMDQLFLEVRRVATAPPS